MKDKGCLKEISKEQFFFRAVGLTFLFFAPAEEAWDFVLWSADIFLKIDWLNYLWTAAQVGFFKGMV